MYNGSGTVTAVAFFPRLLLAMNCDSVLSLPKLHFPDTQSLSIKVTPL